LEICTSCCEPKQFKVGEGSEIRNFSGLEFLKELKSLEIGIMEFFTDK
jgi:hypothetical protein